MQWDLFCRVIDNFGDIGVCWRLAADLGSRGESVRLWTDDASALTWMAPQGAPGVEVRAWPEFDRYKPPSGDVVVEAFGCELPEPIVQGMACASTPPVWLNLEYLSAEPYVERSHGLRSPQLSGPGVGLDKWFFYPGFSPKTGGLIRGAGWMPAAFRQETDSCWLRAHGVVRRKAERVVSLFCYPDAPALHELSLALSDQPTLLLLAAGVAGPERPLPASVRTQQLPHLSQMAYDALLRACDLNFVRGEDTFVRAQWAARPFIWQIYPQSDGAHALKLNAFLDKFLGGASPSVASAMRAAWARWNGLTPQKLDLSTVSEWATHCATWHDSLRTLPDLVGELIHFASKAR